MSDVAPANATRGARSAEGFEYPKEAIISYAQTHEDVLLWRALHSVTPGFYVDVGAHDPTDLSTTRAFYERGWRGINVEPNPLYAAKLRRERPRDLTLEVALGDVPGMATIHDFGATGLSTMVDDIAEGHAVRGFSATHFQVPVTTLAAVLDNLGDQDVHFLKIDVEGYEVKVLNGANFTKVRPWIVLIEAVKPMTSIPTFDTWERLLLTAGYHFVYFDGVNRFYVSEEHLDLRRYFTAPVSIQDPFRDYEVVRLSAAVAGLEQDRLKHEVPRLEGSANASDAHDLSGLRRIIEAQASDLVYLRRGFLSLQAIVSDQRVEIAAAQKEVAEWIHSIVSAKGEVVEWIRSIAMTELVRTQDVINNIIHGSRWRQLGKRLGVVKEMGWEPGGWQTNLFESGDSAGSDSGEANDSVPVPTILIELRRLKDLLDSIRDSRWQRLGCWLGVETRQPWESDMSSASLLLKPFPDIQPYPDTASLADIKLLLDKAMQLDNSPAYADMKSKFSSSSYEGFGEFTNQRFLEECQKFAIDVILDVGANTGQFAQSLRAQGYHGHIISFEPLSEAHAALVRVSDCDPLWDIAERCAIGANDGWAEINIAGNSFSSSLLPMLDLHREAAPQSEYLGKEPCQVITLDTYIERTFSDPTTLFAVKIDTQGYEAEVLAGLKRNHKRAKVIVCELSVAPLYARGPSMSALCHLLAELNYRCVALSPEFEDPRTGELLQVNGIFVKRD